MTEYQAPPTTQCPRPSRQWSKAGGWSAISYCMGGLERTRTASGEVREVEGTVYQQWTCTSCGQQVWRNTDGDGRLA